MGNARLHTGLTKQRENILDAKKYNNKKQAQSFIRHCVKLSSTGLSRVEGEQEGRLHPLEGPDNIRIKKQLVLLPVNITETFPIGLSQPTHCASLRFTSPIWPFHGGISSRISWKPERAPCSHFDHSELGGFLNCDFPTYTLLPHSNICTLKTMPLFFHFVQVVRL